MRTRQTLVTPLAVALLAAASGCQTVQLREGTLNQAASYADVHERQVLDNLAKFVHDVNTFPSFAYSDQGTNQVQDRASVASTTTWQRIGGGLYGWLSTTGTPTAERTAYQNWVLKPVNDPRKLDLMRCAYQAVVRTNLQARGLAETTGPCPPCDGAGCPDCERRFNAYYTGNPATPPAAPGTGAGPGRVTHLCLGTNPVWFAWGCRKDLPKDHRCLKVGHHCGVYVWVLPGGEDELSKLTLAILDYAVNPPREAERPATKRVTLFVDGNGNPVTPAAAVGFLTGEMEVTKPSRSLLKGDLQNQAEAVRRRLEAELRPDTNLTEAATKEKVERVKGLRQQLTDLQAEIQALPDLPPAPAPQRPSLDEVAPLNLQNLQLRLQSLQPIP